MNTGIFFRGISWGIFFLLFTGCGEQTRGPSTGSETHFLRACSASCPGDLSCVCGVCTLPCDADQQCASLSQETVCAELPTSCGQAMGEAVSSCDAECMSDRDCESISTDHRCEVGVCRAPALTGSVINDVQTQDAAADMMSVDVAPDVSIDACDPQVSCAGACVDLNTDEENCGGCGMACAGDQVCLSGACAVAGACMSDVDCGSLQTCLRGECM